jgi:hypothetical protein
MKKKSHPIFIFSSCVPYHLCAKKPKKNACKICRCLKCNRHINCMWFEQWIFYTFPCEHETCAYFVYNGMVHFCHIIFVHCFFHKNIEYLHMKNIFVTQMKIGWDFFFMQKLCFEKSHIFTWDTRIKCKACFFLPCCTLLSVQRHFQLFQLLRHFN